MQVPSVSPVWIIAAVCVHVLQDDVCTWVFHRGRGGGPRCTVAAAGGDLSDVLTLKGCYKRGLPHWVGVSKAELDSHTKTTIQNLERFWCALRANFKSSKFKFTYQDAGYLSLTVAAPGIDVSRGGQSEHMFTAHSNVFYAQPLQRWHHLGAGFILQHGVRQADQALWRMNRRKPSSTEGHTGVLKNKPAKEKILFLQQL